MSWADYNPEDYAHLPEWHQEIIRNQYNLGHSAQYESGTLEELRSLMNEDPFYYARLPRIADEIRRGDTNYFRQEFGLRGDRYGRAAEIVNRYNALLDSGMSNAEIMGGLYAGSNPAGWSSWDGASSEEAVAAATDPNNANDGGYSHTPTFEPANTGGGGDGTVDPTDPTNVSGEPWTWGTPSGNGPTGPQWGAGPVSNYQRPSNSFMNAYNSRRHGGPIQSGGGMMSGEQNPTFVPPQPEQGNGLMGGGVMADDTAGILDNLPRQGRQMGPAEATYREVAKPKESVVKSMFKDVMP